jgi:hypothetical protein
MVLVAQTQSTSQGEAIMRIKIGLALVAALVFSIASTASASAASFLSSAKAKLESLNVATQVFETEAGTTECTEANITAGESTGLEASAQKATIEYKKCTAFGFIEVTITPAEYDFHSNGEVSIEKLISIKTTGCEVSVPAQTVEKVDYATSGNNILLEPLVTGILYTASGGSCRKTGEFKNGTYKGHSEVMIPNGKLSFMTESENLDSLTNEQLIRLKLSELFKVLVVYVGPAGSNSGLLTRTIPSPPLEDEGSDCEKSLNPGETCEIRVRCITHPKLARVEVRGRAGVIPYRVKIDCEP